MKTCIEYEFEAYVVKNILQGSFTNSKLIRSIILPVDSEIKTINKNVISKSSIEKLIISPRVSKLSNGWCSNTPNLTSIMVFPSNKHFMYLDSKIVLGKSDSNQSEYDILLFVNRDLKKVIIPSFIKQIASHAFEYSKIESIIIPCNVNRICESAFNHCYKLKNVKFEKGSKLQIIENDAFPHHLINNIIFPLGYKKEFNSEELDSLNSEELATLIRTGGHSESRVNINETSGIEIIDTKELTFVIDKVKKKIMDLRNTEIKSIYRYCDKYLGYKIPLLIYTIIKCVNANVLLMFRSINILRFIQRNHLLEFKSSFCLAIQQCRIEENHINNNILLIIQNCFCTYILSKNETNEILLHYLNDNELFLIPFIMSERYVIPDKESSLKYKKENHILNEKLKNLENFINEHSHDNNDDHHSNENEEHSFFDEAIKLNQKNKYVRKYSDLYIAISSIAYIFGSKSYAFIRKYFPLPHETLIRKNISPVVSSNVKKLINIDQCSSIIDDFIQQNSDNKDIHVTLAIDAASFKETRGSTIRQKFFDLDYISPDKIYSNIFVFFIQPININMKPFPLYITLKENGNASKETLLCIKKVIQILKEKNIKVDFIATDGDRQYDSLHENFFDIIFNLHKANMTFTQIVDEIANSKMLEIPISDFLHLIKILRSNLVKYGLVLDYKNSVALRKEELNEYKMGKALEDMSSHGKMKDSYPFEIFSSTYILKAIDKKQWSFIFYSIPFNLIINSIRNPHLSHDLRQFNLETGYYFILHYFYQYNKSLAPPISRIGLIRIINTIIGLSVALKKYEFVQMGHIGTHPLENYFGSLRIACHYDHSYFNIFSAIGKSVLIKKLLEELQQTENIRTRLGYGGTHATVENTGGNIPDISPFDLFKSIWSRMKNENADTTYFESWYPFFKTTYWDERISSPSYLSGTSIISRYLNLSDAKKPSDKNSINMKCRKKDLIKKIKEMHTVSGMTTDEVDSLAIEDAFMFFISNYFPIDSHFQKENLDDMDLDDYFKRHYKTGIQNIKDCLELRNEMTISSEVSKANVNIMVYFTTSKLFINALKTIDWNHYINYLSLIKF
ncbi:hypothetical protein M9Y10_039614 [Tritrichomonas musculus]|uniref:Uncharacterized protein n=1 Tax=Tritrichomonas musculus TaxID=1915356 RepID=A0ABR2I7C9_9EUKA